ncbi:histidine phosphatase family protein [Thermus filiformis]|jgi:probable phosphoglycerate mutase|uniref:Phosphoglycerate mutase n=1 Tax=Thermus filiformis TaxID=276 RepID=A0A0A2WN78_THEFI|nr:histidine phosphatase family protein [Thermus filiformis]KGQ21273.1 phosphoglycerate mutase [Thermus filiformis]
MGLLAHFLQGPHKKTTLLLTRAGPVENPEHVLYSHPGLPLSEAGRKALLALPLDRYPVRAVYAPDSLAEEEAARLLARALGVPYVLEPALRERSWGAWEGRSFREIEAEEKALLEAWKEDEAGFCPPGGESLLEAYRRIRPALLDLLARHSGEAVLVVGNCTVNRVALSLALGFPPEEGLRYEQDYARLTVLAFYGREGVLQGLNLG